MIYYFTFGQSHVHPETGEKMKDYWVEIEAPEVSYAITIMNNTYTRRWSTWYTEPQWTGREIYKSFPKGCFNRMPHLIEVKKDIDALFEQKLKAIRNEQARDN